MGFPGGSAVKNPPVKQETRIQSLSREETLEEGMATRSSVLAWRVPWKEEPGGQQSTGSHRVRHDGATERLSRQVEKAPAQKEVVPSPRSHC